MRPRLCECIFVNFDLIHGDVNNDVKLNHQWPGSRDTPVSWSGNTSCQSRRKWRESSGVSAVRTFIQVHSVRRKLRPRPGSPVCGTVFPPGRPELVQR